ncbi:MAG: hypothetical protein K0M63_11560 [Weeksellaceae bacterium]|nr:hypothetical protein [Weeksellaceae bacterium]
MDKEKIINKANIILNRLQSELLERQTEKYLNSEFKKVWDQYGFNDDNLTMSYLDDEVIIGNRKFKLYLTIKIEEILPDIRLSHTQKN